MFNISHSVCQCMYFALTAFRSMKCECVSYCPESLNQWVQSPFNSRMTCANLLVTWLYTHINVHSQILWFQSFCMSVYVFLMLQNTNNETYWWFTSIMNKKVNCLLQNEIRWYTIIQCLSHAWKFTHIALTFSSCTEADRYHLAFSIAKIRKEISYTGVRLPVSLFQFVVLWNGCGWPSIMTRLAIETDTGEPCLSHKSVWKNVSENRGR